jgi:hypothetical protein
MTVRAHSRQQHADSCGKAGTAKEPGSSQHPQCLACRLYILVGKARLKKAQLVIQVLKATQHTS